MLQDLNYEEWDTVSFHSDYLVEDEDLALGQALYSSSVDHILLTRTDDLREDLREDLEGITSKYGDLTNKSKSREHVYKVYTLYFEEN